MKKSTIIRSLIFFAGLINGILVITGNSPFDGEIYKDITALTTAITAIWGWWKNNSFTKEAIKADEYLRKIR